MRIARGRPIRSETGPQAKPPSATASTTTEIDEAGKRRADVEVARELRQDRLRRVHRREHSGRSEHEAGERLFERMRRPSRQAMQPGIVRGPGWRTTAWHPTPTPLSSRSSPPGAASCSTAASRRSYNGSSRRPAGRLQTDAEDIWGTWPLYRAPEAVADVHRSYVAAGCDVISTDTWSVLADARGGDAREVGLLHWMDIARTGIRLARTAASEAVPGPCAVAFSVSEEAESLARDRSTRSSSGSSPTSRPTSCCSRRFRSSASRTPSPSSKASSSWDCRSGSRSGAAGTVSAASTASTGARRRATSSAGRRVASRRSASARS